MGDEPVQMAVIAFLSDPATHAGNPVDRISTHGAHVFMAGAKAFKLKRAVILPFLDFSTVEKRQAMLAKELTLNRSLGADIYEEVRPIRRGARGLPTFGGDGEILDWVLVMRRFPQADLLDNLAARGALTVEMIDILAARVSDMHAGAAPRRGGGGKSFAEAALDNIGALRAASLPRAALDVLDHRLRRGLAHLADHLNRRAADGHVRRCHGDLHLGNIVLIDGAPTPFDALEFDDDLATGDVYYDLAFTIMDLEHRGHPELANRLLNRYLAATGDIEGLRGLHLFIAIRALVRAKVAAISAGPSGTGASLATALSYLSLAEQHLVPTPARLIGVGGLSGTGKSVLAVQLSPRLGPPPGAIVLRSDIIRKILAGVPETTRLGKEFYTAAFSTRVYEHLLASAKTVLESGLSVVVDAVFGQERERAMLERIAKDTATAFTGLWLEAPLAVRLSRVASRTHDASDADAAVAEMQEHQVHEIAGWLRCDAGGTPEDTLERATQFAAG